MESRDHSLFRSYLSLLLVLPDDAGEDYDYFRHIVNEVNVCQVPVEEILSFSLYRYNRKKAEIQKISE